MSFMMNKQTNKGFTIIEVVLVLAIAALIFLIVFLAVPALQRNQRDTQRRADAARAIAQLQNYQSNHNGTVPANQSEVDSFKAKYLSGNGSSFKDPLTGSDYDLTRKDGTSADRPTDPGNMFYYSGATCQDGNM